MKIASLGSGSKGNATIVSSDDGSNILIDCGFSLRQFEKRLSLLSMAPQDIDAILITHEHSDHCGGVVRILNALPSKTELQLLEIREDRSVSRVSCYNAQKTFDENLRVMLQEASRQDLVGRNCKKSRN